MNKTIYRITIFADACNGISETLAVLAAKSNGGNFLSLAQLKSVADGKAIEYPSLYEGVHAELIGDNLLHVDMKRGDEYRQSLVLEMVEIFEPAEELEETGAMAE